MCFILSFMNNLGYFSYGELPKTFVKGLNYQRKSRIKFGQKVKKNRSARIRLMAVSPISHF